MQEPEKRKLLSVAAVLLFTGCTPTYQQASERERSAILENQRRNCRDYGFKDGTDAFAACMQQGINARNQAVEMDNARRRAALAEAFKTPPQQTTVYQLPQPAVRQPVYQNQSLHCTSTPLGETVYTNCN